MIHEIPNSEITESERLLSVPNCLNLSQNPHLAKDERILLMKSIYG
jgi:hypothetical protein